MSKTMPSPSDEQLSVIGNETAALTRGHLHTVDDSENDVRLNPPTPGLTGVIAPSHPSVVRAVRYLLSRFELSHGHPVPPAIAVVACLRGEGVTTISRAVAEVLSVDFLRSVCWVDLSWAGDERQRKDSAAGVDDTSPSGIRDVLTVRAALDESLIFDASGTLAHLTAGSLSESSRRTLARRPEFDKVIEELRGRFDVLVFDCAPVLGNSEAVTLLRYADTHLLVARQGVATMEQISTVADDLEAVPSMGALLNRYRTRTPRFIRRLFPS